MTTSSDDRVRQNVRDAYAAVARSREPMVPATTESGSASSDESQSVSCCAPSCCTPAGTSRADEISMGLGYSAEDVEAMPEGANMGLGCGNPQAIAALSPGETVLDLGSGGGFDCFLAAKQVGDSGRVIGVDMTPDMLSLARANAEKLGLSNVEFRLGEIEHLPVADASVDAILSNCVINLSPNKRQVFADAFRVLTQGGRLAISDVVATEELPEAVASDLELVSGCIGGAASVQEIRGFLEDAGFTQIEITINEASRQFIASWAPDTGLERYVASATIEAVKG